MIFFGENERTKLQLPVEFSPSLRVFLPQAGSLFGRGRGGFLWWRREAAAAVHEGGSKGGGGGGRKVREIGTRTLHFSGRGGALADLKWEINVYFWQKRRGLKIDFKTAFLDRLFEGKIGPNLRQTWLFLRKKPSAHVGVDDFLVNVILPKLFSHFQIPLRSLPLSSATASSGGGASCQGFEVFVK